MRVLSPSKQILVGNSTISIDMSLHDMLDGRMTATEYFNQNKIPPSI